MGELAIIDTTGDSKLLWNKQNQDEVNAAKAMFKKLKKKGFLAYTVKDNGKQGEILRNFDINLERIIMVPPIVGG